MQFSDLLVAMLFGFPAVIVSLLISAIGVLKEKVWLVVGSALALREKNRLWVRLLLLPPLLAVLWVLGVVLLSARP